MGRLFKNARDVVDLDPDDFEELKNRVYSFYGKPSIVVELPDETFQNVIIKAVQQLNTYAAKIDRIFKSVQPNLGRYTIYEYERINSVLDVYVSTDYLIGLGLPFQSLLGIPMSFSATHNPEVLTNFVSLYSAYDVAKRMFGVQPIAELVEPNVVELTPIPYTETVFCFCITVNHDKDLGSLSEFEIRWLTDYCTATTGKIIGQIRRKYDGVTLPVGTLSTSGSSIYAESVEWEKALMEELKSRKKFAQTFITVG
jgi:hypothetical protein